MSYFLNTAEISQQAIDPYQLGQTGDDSDCI